MEKCVCVCVCVWERERVGADDPSGKNRWVDEKQRDMRGRGGMMGDFNTKQ